MFLLVVAVVVLFSLWRHKQVSPIRGAFVVPSAPFVGNTFSLLNNPAKKLMEWSAKYEKSVFVVHLGPKPVLVAHSHRDVSILLNRHSAATKSRPVFHTFHNIVSAAQGFTVGSTPASDTCTRKKKCISRFLASKSVHASHSCHILNESSQIILSHLLRNCLASPARSRLSDVSLLRHAQNFVLMTQLSLTYGYQIQPYSKLASDVIETENHIIKLRSPIANYQDYLPVLSSFPGLFSEEASYWAARRDKYMDFFGNHFDKMYEKGNYAAEMSLLGQSKQQQTRGLPVPSAQEMRSICLTMVSAGLDNVSLNYDHLMGHLAKPYGYPMQERLFSELISVYGSLDNAWDGVSIGFSDCPYALALIHEGMRFFSVLPLGLPRETTHNFTMNGMTVPSGTMVLVNAFAANHDGEVFPDPYEFRPDRWLDSEGKLNKLRHFALGAGSRQCSGSILAVQELYTLVCRTILIFSVRRPTDTSFEMNLDSFAANSAPRATSFEPQEFKVWLRPRPGECFANLHRRILC